MLANARKAQNSGGAQCTSACAATGFSRVERVGKLVRLRARYAWRSYPKCWSRSCTCCTCAAFIASAAVDLAAIQLYRPGQVVPHSSHQLSHAAATAPLEPAKSSIRAAQATLRGGLGGAALALLQVPVLSLCFAKHSNQSTAFGRPTHHHHGTCSAAATLERKPHSWCQR